MESQRTKVGPDLVAYTDEPHTKLTIEVTIPGAAKKDIDLKMHGDSFYLLAPAKDIEYVAAYSFCCPVKPEKAQAAYDNGILTIEVPFKDEMEDTIKIPVKAKITA